MFVNRKSKLVRLGLLVTLLTLAILGIAYAQGRGLVPTKLTPNNAIGRINGQIVVSARLTEFYSGRPIVSARVRPTVVYENYSVPLGPVYTDSNGYARVTLSPNLFNAPGSYYIGWTYEGTGYYSPPVPMSNVTATR